MCWTIVFSLNYFPFYYLKYLDKHLHFTLLVEKEPGCCELWFALSITLYIALAQPNQTPYKGPNLLSNQKIYQGPGLLNSR